MPMFGYKNHLGIDRARKFIHRFIVTDAERRDGAQLGAVLASASTGSGVWPDTAYRSTANLESLDRRGLRGELQRAKLRGRPMPAHIARGIAIRTRVPGLVDYVFAVDRRRMGLVVRCIGLARATAKITLANLAYNVRRLAWIEGRAVHVWQDPRRARVAARRNSPSRPPAPMLRLYQEARRRPLAHD